MMIPKDGHFLIIKYDVSTIYLEIKIKNHPPTMQIFCPTFFPPAFYYKA